MKKLQFLLPRKVTNIIIKDLIPCIEAPKEPEQFTLEEYYSKRNIKHNKEEEVKPEIKKIDPKQKIEGLEVIENREMKTINDRNVNQKVKDNTHKVALASENADLLCNKFYFF